MFPTSFDQHVSVAKHVEKLSEFVAVTEFLFDPNDIPGRINGAEVSFFADIHTENGDFCIGIFYQVLSHLVG
ncbi:hypothetical protein D3C86_1965040 [compost metagenome]